jgi:hypothetical protein
MEADMDEIQFAAITKRLDAIIALVASSVQKTEHSPNLRETIQILSSAGLEPVDIASIVGKPRTDVNSILAKIKGKKSDLNKAKKQLRRNH